MSNNISIIGLPDEDDLGPAMKACSDAEREFVVSLFNLGCRNYTDAAFATGRYKDRGVAQAASSRFMARGHVVAALDEHTRTIMKMGLPLATKALMELVVGADSDAVRFKAATELMNRNGHIVETVQRHIVEDRRTTREMIVEAVQLARKNGLDPRTLLGNIPQDILDAEFSEVISETNGSEGLEDILS